MTDQFEINLTVRINELLASLEAAASSGQDVDDILKSIKAELKNLSSATGFEKFIRAGFGEGGLAILSFRDKVEAAKQEIERLRTTFGQTFSDTVAGFQQLNAVTKQFSTLEIRTAVQELNQIRIEKLIGVFQQLQAAGLTAKEAEAQFRQLNNTTKQFSDAEIKKAVAALHQLESAAKGADDDVNKLGQSFKSLDSFTSRFFGFTIATLAVQALQALKREFNEIIERGEAFSRTQFNMATAVRALQRVGIDVTLAEFGEQVDSLSERFGFFTKRELQEGIAQIALLTRNVDISKEEIFQLSEATATLAIITGKDFAEEGLLVARSIASGYTEALQRAGIAANRLAIQEKALELGIDKTFLQMTEQERASVTLALVLDQVAAVSGDTAAFQETLAGSVQKSRTEIGDLKDELGQRFLPFYAAFLKALAGGLEFISKVFTFVFEVFKTTTATFFGSLIGLTAAIKAFTSGTAISLSDFSRIVGESILQTKAAIDDIFDGEQFSDLPPELFGEFADDIADELDEEVVALEKKIDDILTRFANDIRDAAIDFQRELADIDLKATRKVEDEEIKRLQDLEKINRQTQDRIADAQSKYRENELKSERKFQEKLKKLREDFLFDLEDALRERDAKQVLRLLRQFQLRQGQLEREKEIEDAERAEAYQNELKDIELQRQRKIRELEIEFQERKDAIALNRERERADALTAYNREIEDLNRHLQDRLNLLRSGLSAELQLWFDFYLNLANVHRQFAAVNQPRVTLGGGSSPLGGPKGGNLKPPPKQKPKAFAEGGILVARKPTLAIFGDSPGGEIVNFSPIRGGGRDEGKVFGGSLPAGMSRSGRAVIELRLRDGLVADIQDETLGKFADIMIREVG